VGHGKKHWILVVIQIICDCSIQKKSFEFTFDAQFLFRDCDVTVTRL